MAEFYLILLVAGIIWLLLQVVWNPVRMLEYPYFMAAVFAAFILPQAVSLLRFPGRVSQEAIEAVMLMSCLCLLAAALGYKLSPSISMLRRLGQAVNPTRLFHVGLFFIASGYVFTYLMATTARQFNDAGGMTGIATVYLFFANLVFPGFAICLMLLLRQFSWTKLGAVIAGGIIPVINVISVRREPAAMLALTIVLALFYVRRKPPSRLAFFAALLFAMLAIPATGIYRSLMDEGTVSAARQMDLIGNFNDFVNRETILELRNGAAVIEATRRFSQYDFGAGYWNQVVFRYVPAQFVGMQRKNALMIGTTVQEMLAGRTAAGYEFNTGSTVTGMGDAFQHFGWFGCLFFAVLAVFFRSVWVASLQPNGMFAQLLYILICTSAMRAVTHQTVDFLPGLFYQLIFLTLGLLYARQRPPRAVPVHRR